MDYVASSTFEFKAGQEKTIINGLKNDFPFISESSNAAQRIISRIELGKGGEKTIVNFYSTGKLLIQGKEGILFQRVKTLMSQNGLPELTKEKQSKYMSELDENTFYKERDFIVGFDEAGTGETIGSAMFAAVILPKNSLHHFSNLRKDIKSMPYSELNYYCDLIKKKGIKVEYVIASPYEVCNSGFNKNRFMDKKYVDLIRKISHNLNKNYILMLDDYGVREDIKDYLNNLDKQGIKSICRDKLDENITACKLASIVARHIRLSEVESLEKNNRLQFEGKEVSFGKGGNSDQTNNWLKTFRILNPTLDFPDFVKKSWDNVKEIESIFPRKVIPMYFECKTCCSKITRILAYHTSDENSLKFYCSDCNKEIEKDSIPKNSFPYILADTNALVIGTISHDLRCIQSVFEGSRVLIPHKIMHEIDTIGRSKKIGAQKELERLKELEGKGKIHLNNCDFEITSPFDADKKLYDLIAKNNSCALITADKNLAISAHINNSFVFHIINYIPQPKGQP